MSKNQTIAELVKDAGQNADSKSLPLYLPGFRNLATQMNGVEADYDAVPLSDEDPEILALMEEKEKSLDFIRSFKSCSTEGFEAPEFDDVSFVPVPPSNTDLSQAKAAYFDAWTENPRELRHQRLAEQVMKQEISERNKAMKTMNASDEDWVGRVMTHVLQSSEDCIIESVAFGNLAKDRRRNRRLGRVAMWLWDRARFQPSIYYQQLVDSSGDSPTPQALEWLRKLMQRYVKIPGTYPAAQALTRIPALKDAEVLIVDGFKHTTDKEWIRNGFRRYLYKKTYVDKKPAGAYTTIGKPYFDKSPGYLQRVVVAYTSKVAGNKTKWKVYTLSDSHVTNILAFVDSLKTRLAAIGDKSPAWKEPLKHPLCEVGYAVASIDRLKSHAAHINSNYIMNLAEASCELYRRLARVHPNAAAIPTGDWRIHQSVIYLIWAPSQAEISEIGWTKLAEGYTGNGGGFSHYPAGCSNYSAQTVFAETWTYAARVVRDASPFTANCDAVSEYKQRVTEARIQEVSKLNAEEWDKLLQDQEALANATTTLLRNDEGLKNKLRDARKRHDAVKAKLVAKLTEETERQLESLRKQTTPQFLLAMRAMKETFSDAADALRAPVGKDEDHAFEITQQEREAWQRRVQAGPRDTDGNGDEDLFSDI